MPQQRTQGKIITNDNKTKGKKLSRKIEETKIKVQQSLQTTKRNENTTQRNQ